MSGSQWDRREWTLGSWAHIKECGILDLENDVNMRLGQEGQCMWVGHMWQPKVLNMINDGRVEYWKGGAWAHWVTLEMVRALALGNGANRLDGPGQPVGADDGRSHIRQQGNKTYQSWWIINGFWSIWYHYPKPTGDGYGGNTQKLELEKMPALHNVEWQADCRSGRNPERVGGGRQLMQK